MWPDLKDKIIVESEQLQLLVELYKPLIGQCRDEHPSDYDVAALGAMLQSFYNGVENIFQRITRDLGEPIAKSEDWHRRLLETVKLPSARRPRVISGALHDRLLEHQQFRHVFRSAYLFQLHWPKMSPLVFNVEELLDDLEEELDLFIEEMNKWAEGEGRSRLSPPTPR